MILTNLMRRTLFVFGQSKKLQHSIFTTPANESAHFLKPISKKSEILEKNLFLSGMLKRDSPANEFQQRNTKT